MSKVVARMDEFDIDLDSRSAIHLYCDRARQLANALAVELQLASKELRVGLKVTPLADRGSGAMSRATRPFIAKKVASGLWRASELSAAIAFQAVKTALMFDQYYVGVSIEAGKRRAVAIDK
jgi:hypothetical protein